MIVSSDALLGNADDLVADGPQFAHTGGLAVNASYSQTQTISVPFAFAGHLYIFVKTDVAGAITEPGGEGNNGAGDPLPVTVNEVAVVWPMTEGFESGSLALLPNWWAFDYGPTSRVRVVGSDTPHSGAWHLLLDTSGSSYELQAAHLTVDLASQKGAVLRYWQKEFVDEYDHILDAVSVSADGVKWYRLESLMGSESALVYQQHVLALDAAMQLVGIGPDTRFYLRFQRYNAYSVPRAGFAFDDFQLAVETGDLWGARVVNCTPTGLTTRPLETIQITFSEPIAAATFTNDRIQLLDPS